MRESAIMIFTLAGTVYVPKIGATPTKAAILINGQRYCVNHERSSDVVNVTFFHQ